MRIEDILANKENLVRGSNYQSVLCAIAEVGFWTLRFFYKADVAPDDKCEDKRGKRRLAAKYNVEPVCPP